MLIKVKIIPVLLLLVWLISACASDPAATPTPLPSPTRPDPVPRNENVEALNAAQAALAEIEFGFAPLLLEDEAEVVLETLAGEEFAQLAYPEQPADPTRWSTVDSFVSAYGVREALLDTAQVTRVALGRFSVSASVEDEAENVEHVATWITFRDGSRAIVDLSPLSTNFAPRHAPDRMMLDAAQMESLFADRRSGVDLRQLQPMKVVEEAGQLYYLLAKLVVSYNQYQFILQIHPVQIADPMRPMNLRPGAIAAVEVDRAEFEALQQELKEAGPTAFTQTPDLLTRRGKVEPATTDLLDDHLELLWHLVVKFKHQPPDPNQATPTPTATPTPRPTATPTPTATPKKLPLLTS